MTEDLTFLPWLRRGLAQAIDVVDDATGSPLASGATMTASVTVGGMVAECDVRLLGPEHAAGLSTTQILRTEPRADSGDVEPGYFPFVDLESADLPWLLTPASAAPDGPGRLRPWLVLVVVREQEGVNLGPYPETSLPVLRIGSPADPTAELPDLAESWAWAHVQSRVAVAEVPAAVESGTGQVVARLVCPRHTLPATAWLACVVPAFRAGADRGLGRPVEDGAQLLPAWNDGDALVELPVYHSWRFTTGPAGDFEALCRRLKPDGDGADLGRFPMDVGDPGLVTPTAKRVLLDMEGALQTPEVRSRPWDPTHRADFQRDIGALLDASIARADYNADADDPVVAPPLYGAWPAGVVTEVPARGWVPELNRHPVHRAAAGLGAEVSLSLTRRAAALPDPDLLQLTARLHAFLPSGETTVRAQLAASAAPGGLVSTAALRQSRPGTPLARDWQTWTGSPQARLGAEHVQRTLDATSPAAEATLEPALAYAAFGLPHGAQAEDRTLTEVAEPSRPANPDPRLADAVDGLVGVQLSRMVDPHRVGRTKPDPAGGKRKPGPPGRKQAGQALRAAPTSPTGPLGEPDPRGRSGPKAPPVISGPDVSGLAATVRQALDPTGAARASVVARIPALAGLVADDALPTTLGLAPVFEDPLSEDLTRLSTTWMLPGVGSIRRNRVRLVEVNTAFVAQFLIGANHELARELLWRGYPVDVRATFFHRFWDYTGDPPRDDISDLAGWGHDDSIAENLDTEAVASTVIVVRGDLVRRYPSARYFLQQAALVGEDAVPVEDSAPLDPIFQGALAADTVFFGFEPDSATVRGDRPNRVPGYFLAIEEQAGAPRFGLDPPKPGHFTDDPASWNDASWGHLVRSEAELDALRHATAANERLTDMGELEGVTWGRNAAHLARACWQQPFRMYIHADLLI